MLLKQREVFLLESSAPVMFTLPPGCRLARSKLISRLLRQHHLRLTFFLITGSSVSLRTIPVWLFRRGGKSGRVEAVGWQWVAGKPWDLWIRLLSCQQDNSFADAGNPFHEPGEIGSARHDTTPSSAVAAHPSPRLRRTSRLLHGKLQEPVVVQVRFTSQALPRSGRHLVMNSPPHR